MYQLFLDSGCVRLYNGQADGTLHVLMVTYAQKRLTGEIKPGTLVEVLNNGHVFDGWRETV